MRHIINFYIIFYKLDNRDYLFVHWRKLWENWTVKWILDTQTLNEDWVKCLSRAHATKWTISSNNFREYVSSTSLYLFPMYFSFLPVLLLFFL